MDRIKTKVLLIMVAVIVVVTFLSSGTGAFFSRSRLISMINDDMYMAANIAAKLVSSRLELLESEFDSVAGHLSDVPDHEIPGILESQAKRFEYLSLAVFDADQRLVAAYGDPLPEAGHTGNNYARRAYAHETVISSTEIVQDKGIVIRIYGPVGDRIMVATLPGFVMSDLLSEFKVMGVGNIFILDHSGIMIANKQPRSVLERYNILEMAGRRELYVDSQHIFEDMVRGGEGMGRYRYDGEERFCAYMPIPGSDQWSVGVTVASSKTSVAQTYSALLLAAAIILVIGGGVAFFAADMIARPFQVIRRQNVSLMEFRQVAEQASEAKSRFLANTSHEMRTPLNAIIGLSELMLDGGEDLPREVEENLGKIYNSGVTLLGIINDLLDISKIESGRFELVPVKYDVPSMINDTRSLNVLRIMEKPIQFILSVESTLPSRLFGDELRIKQIFNNLLSNACKYTQSGVIEWTLSHERKGHDIWLISRIRDSGIGIRKGDVERLFSDYAQLDTRSNRKIEGTGLGLSITKKLVDMMHGTIKVESVYGEGSVFTVRLLQKFVTDTPIGGDVAKNLMSSHYTEGKRFSNKKLVRESMPYAKVLVVDDVQTNLDVVKGIMKPYGMQVDCVTRGAEAIDLVRDGRVQYNAIFMDHMMPEMDGMEATRIIRKEIDTEYARTVPIIALTANAVVGNEKLFLENGFQAFLSKPIDLMKMDATLKEWVRDKAREEGRAQVLPEGASLAPGENAALHPEGAENRGLDKVEGILWKQGLLRFNDEEGLYIEVLESYLSNTRHLLEEIRDFREEKAGDYAIIIHGIKGSSYGIEAKDIGKKAEALEHAAKAGDIGFIREHHPVFVRELEKLLSALSACFTPDQDEKETKDAPDPALLAQMREAAGDFRIDQMEQIMGELECFSYKSQNDLIIWLREQVAAMDFMKIQEALSSKGNPSHF